MDPCETAELEQSQNSVTAAFHQKWPLERPCKEFIDVLLPLYSAPYVKIRIEPAGTEYKLPKGLLCQQSPFFAAAFNGKFREGKEQFMPLKEEEGVVSTRSFELLVQWMHIGRVIFDELPPEEAITATIEFARLADMCGVQGMENSLAEHIRNVLLKDRPPSTKTKRKKSDIIPHYLTSKHIISAVLLPNGHPVRTVLASAAVPGYFTHDEYLNEALEVPEFAVDLLKEVQTAIRSFQSRGSVVSFVDPLSDSRLTLQYEG